MASIREIRAQEYGRHSKGWKVWNDTNPEDPILPDTGYVLHHKDHDHSNNAPSNLKKMTTFAHMSYHMKRRTVSEKTRRKMADSKVGHQHSEETKRKISASKVGKNLGWIPWNKGIPVSEETRRKMSIAQLGIPQSTETKKKISAAMKASWNKRRKEKNHPIPKKLRHEVHP